MNFFGCENKTHILYYFKIFFFSIFGQNTRFTDKSTNHMLLITDFITEEQYKYYCNIRTLQYKTGLVLL